ncbi:asparagine synthase-related protein [Natronosalvus vescus]|uniref:asparagine synthase-related protein n=1 Tax=Natronosalvus vescus TaxID=2953881 RepID=UPI002091DB75|nr:asparagine synthase-related protein [Natronosalvus vescus]
MDSNLFDERISVEAFLGYRYIPEPTVDFPENVLEAAQANYPSTNDPVKRGREVVKETFERSVDQHSSTATHLLPLSGGLDSRLILGGLLDNVDRDQIITVTFGTPGTGDYEIGQHVADIAGVENYAVDLRPSHFPWSSDRMINVASTYKRPTHLFRAVAAILYALERLDIDDPICWSGFMGDPSAGARLPKNESASWDTALDKFVEENLVLPELTSDSFDPYHLLPDEPAVGRDVLSYDEQLDFGVRQRYFIEEPATLKGQFETPFLEDPWLSFMLSLPREQRRNRRAFHEIALETYPELFDGVPTETKAGLPIDASEYHRKVRLATFLLREKSLKAIGRPEPTWVTNHFDWDVELRRSAELRDLIGQQLADLRKRDRVSWLEIDGIWRSHHNGDDNADVIRQLASLELFLKAEERQ